ncbi:metallophosphoesterase [bacterium]|nr:metallophosphoesterase [candidate division CSSED10-310 bacterium]
MKAGRFTSVLTMAVLTTLGTTSHAHYPGDCRYTYEHHLLWFFMIADVHMGEDLLGGDQDSEYLGWFINTLTPVSSPYLVVLCGDIVDGSDGWFWPGGGPYQSEWNEYRGVIDAAGMDPNFWMDLPGNHDAYADGDLDYYIANSVQGEAFGYRETSVRKNMFFGSYNFVGASTCQDINWDWPMDDTGLNEEELAFLETRLEENEDCDLTFCFGHHPVDTLNYGKNDFLRLLTDYNVSLYGYGHTHEFGIFWQQETLHYNINSIGKGDHDHFALFTVDGNGLAVSNEDVMDWPYVVITAPLDSSLGGAPGNRYTYPVPRMCGTNPVRALVLTNPRGDIQSVECRIDGGTWLPMNTDPSPAYRDLVWEGFFDGTVHTFGDHTLEVRVIDGSDRSNTDVITMTLANNQCTDGIDNDGDGATDMEDCGCPDPLDDNEWDCTNSPTPRPTRTPSPTPYRTATPSSTGTPPTPSGSTTPAPTLPPESGSYLLANASSYSPGDEFLLQVVLVNIESYGVGVQHYIVLDLAGAYWFWPTWTPELHFVSLFLPASYVDTFEILRFTWPGGVGTIRDIRFWAALLEESTSMLFGNYSYCEFDFIE